LLYFFYYNVILDSNSIEQIPITKTKGKKTLKSHAYLSEEQQKTAVIQIIEIKVKIKLGKTLNMKIEKTIDIIIGTKLLIIFFYY